MYTIGFKIRPALSCFSPNLGGRWYCVLWPTGWCVVAIRARPNNTVANLLYSRAAVVHSHKCLVAKSRVLKNLRIVHSGVNFVRQTRIALHVKLIKGRRRELCIL